MGPTLNTQKQRLKTKGFAPILGLASWIRPYEVRPQLQRRNIHRDHYLRVRTELRESDLEELLLLQW